MSAVPSSIYKSIKRIQELREGHYKRFFNCEKLPKHLKKLRFLTKSALKDTVIVDGKIYPFDIPGDLFTFGDVYDVILMKFQKVIGEVLTARPSTESEDELYDKARELCIRLCIYRAGDTSGFKNYYDWETESSGAESVKTVNLDESETEDESSPVEDNLDGIVPYVNQNLQLDVNEEHDETHKKLLIDTSLFSNDENAYDADVSSDLCMKYSNSVPSPVLSHYEVTHAAADEIYNLRSRSVKKNLSAQSASKKYERKRSSVKKTYRKEKI